MEVHHHAHPAAAWHRKKWTHYLFEFLMLFLAVFAGFLAENQREHFVEAKRAKVYAQSLLNDLKADTAEVNSAIRAERFRQASMDSLILYSKSLKGNLTVPGKFYYYSRFVSNLYTIDWYNSTLNQLIQAGNLRLFGNKNLIDKINTYYSSQSTITRSTSIAHERRVKLLEVRSQLLLSRYYILFGGTDYMVELNKPGASLDTALLNNRYPLSRNADVLFDEYINLLIDGRWYQELSLKRYPQIIKDATEIMQLLKDKYKIE